MSTTSQVAERIETSRIHEEPFPHLEIRGLFPSDDFARIAAAIPPLENFKPAKNETKRDLDITGKSAEFKSSPDETQQVWSWVRDDVFRETVAPLLVRRFEEGIRDKYEFFFGEEVAAEIMEQGFTSSDGRIMCRKPGYALKPHLDSAHFAVTCLLYFSSAGAADSGALCLFSPEHQPEVKHASTYYPEREEGIAVEVEKTIPLEENLFVAFLNGPRSLHGFSVDKKRSDEGFSRFVYQTHIVPRDFDVRKIYDRLDERSQSRWERFVGAAG